MPPTTPGTQPPYDSTHERPPLTSHLDHDSEADQACVQCGTVLPAAWQYSEPHERADRPGIACTYVRLFDVRYRLDDIRDGDYPHDDVREHLIDCTPDDEATAVDLAVDGLRDYGLSADDSCRWFFDPDGSQVVNHYTGEHSEVTGHLYGFAQAEQTRIRQKIITNS